MTRDGDRGGYAYAGNERKADHHQTQQGDHHGDPREQHGTSGGSHGTDRRIGWICPLPQQFSVAGHKEQRVVDSHPESDHRGESGSELGATGNVGGEHRCGDTANHAEQSDPYRKAHSQHRSCGQDQDEDGESNADQFRLRGFKTCQSTSADLHLQAVKGGNQIFDLCTDGTRAFLVDVLAELDRRVGDLPVSRDASTAGGARVVGRQNHRTVDLVGFAEHLSHDCDHVWIVNTLLSGIHDASAEPAARPAESTEVLVECVKPGFGF